MSAEPIAAASPTEPTQAIQHVNNQPRSRNDWPPAPGAAAPPPGRSWKAQVAWLAGFSTAWSEAPTPAGSGGSLPHSHQMPPHRIA
jgi:hypothetical protein